MDLTACSNKTADFAFCGHKLRFLLSQALFSSYDVDSGSRLLLKSVAQQLDLPSLRSILDVGCGTGVLGVSVAKVSPTARLVMQDRDALAAAFARENAVSNSIEYADVRGALGTNGTEPGSFDLVLCNIPAKAGEPVIRAMVSDVCSRLTEGGTAALVIVLPLVDLLRSSVDQADCRIVHEEASRDHAVMHVAGRSSRSACAAGGPACGGDQRGAPQLRASMSSTGAVSDEESFAPYHRASPQFAAAGVSYDLRTVYGLPDFDSLGRSLELLLPVVAAVAGGGSLERQLYWNPGQGHAAAVAELTGTSSARRRWVLAGRDLLQLDASERNLISLSVTESKIDRFHVPGPEELTGRAPAASLDLFCAFLDSAPCPGADAELARVAAELLRENGAFIVSGPSTRIQRLVAGARGFRGASGRKKHGYRVVAMERS